ncbi:MAG: hypothetical protein RLZZ200_2860 [Pseudomonadota bacterium]|jgi:PAS domain S-box-containing protein
MPETQNLTGAVAWAWPALGAVLALVAVGLGAMVLRLRTRLALAETMLREQSSQFESVAEILPQALWIGSPVGETHFMNRRFKTIAGHRAAVDAGAGLPTSVHPDDVERYRAARSNTMSTHAESLLDVRLRTLDGPYRWWQLHVVPRFNAEGQLMQWVGSYTDIHDLKEAEAALRLSEERYRLILDTSHDAVLLVDRDNKIRFANDTVRTVFGREPASLIGQSLSILQPPGLRDGHAAGMARYLSSGQRKLDWRATEVLALHAEGHEFPVEISFAEFSSNQERLFVAFIHDLTARREVERQNQMLELRLREAQQLEAIGTLAGGIAHGINNTLATILGNLQLATESGGAEADLRSFLDEIFVAAHRARGLVRQILLFSRRELPQSRRCDVSTIVLDVVAFLRSMLPDRIEIRLDSAEQLPPVIGDPRQIEMALVSLATNASEAIGDDAGRIAVNVDAVTLADADVPRLPGLKAGTYVRIRVEDNGRGMDAETLRRAFEPFFTTGSEAQHAGIGLSVVHGIVSAHHGMVTADSTPGRGSCFTLHFPASGETEAAASATGDVTEPGSAPAPAHVLFVDDEESLVTLMQRLLKRRGYEVTAFTDPVKALATVRAAAAGTFDVVLTDQNMPGMSGVELARELRTLRPDLPVAILSGHVTDSLRGEAAAAGAIDVLYKENLVEQLSNRIEEFVRERALRTTGADAPIR